ncbi:hypothetical protein GCM10010398_68100 [Streptomyces fimbriatus]
MHPTPKRAVLDQARENVAMRRREESGAAFREERERRLKAGCGSVDTVRRIAGARPVPPPVGEERGSARDQAPSSVGKPAGLASRRPHDLEDPAFLPVKRWYPQRARPGGRITVRRGRGFRRWPEAVPG